MLPLWRTTTGYLRTALVMAAFLLASQPARASALLFAMPPQISFAAPDASEALEVHLTSAGSGRAMTVGFSIDLAPAEPAMVPHAVAAPAPRMRIFSGASSFSPGIALDFVPDMGTTDPAFSGPAALAPGADEEFGYASYSITPGAAPGSVVVAGFPSPDAGAPLWDSARDPENGEDTFAMGPQALFPAGLLLIAMGTIRERQFRSGRKRRTIPGVRKPPMHEELEPSQAEPCPRYVAV